MPRDSRPEDRTPIRPNLAAVALHTRDAERAANNLAAGMSLFQDALNRHDRDAQESARLSVCAATESYLDALMAADKEATNQ